MSAIGHIGSRSYRAIQPELTPERVADQAVSAMNFTTPQGAYDSWMGQNPGTGREFLKLVRSQLTARGISVEA